MIEQSGVARPLYWTRILTDKDGKETRVAGEVSPHRLKFGPAQLIHIQPKIGSGWTWSVIDKNPTPDTLGSTLKKREKELGGHLFYVGKVEVTTDDEYKVDDYWIKQTPLVTLEHAPETPEELPPSFSGSPYPNTFSYPKPLINALYDIKAAWVDRWKVPMNPEALIKSRYFPIDAKKSTMTFGQLVRIKTNFPIVILLSDTPYAIVDLEPGYTQEEYETFLQYPAYYHEQTPRGGWHALVKRPTNIDLTKIRKAQITLNMEIHFDSPITVYGGGTWLSNHVDEITVDESHLIKERTPIVIQTLDGQIDPKPYIKRLADMGVNLKRGTMRAWNSRNDLSEQDFLALVWLNRHAIEPFANQLRPEERISLLYQLGKTYIPYRDKHLENRRGVSYLMYLVQVIRKEDMHE